jgi:DNA polymerase-4
MWTDAAAGLMAELGSLMVQGFCRDCLTRVERDDARCSACGSTRLVRHPELFALTLAHIDCDAFYASIEKRDDPSLDDKPLIVGGGVRGVVTTACYIARRSGVRSAMPMFKALKLCPEATVIRPNMAKYAGVSAQVRAIFLDATPLVEPLSLDEAYLDLSGTEKLHREPPATTLARVAKRIESEIGITVSIGLSHNKLLAKLASELDKPRGFGVVGRAETVAFLSTRHVRVLPGIGPKAGARLAEDGIETVAQLQALGDRGLKGRYGSWGERLADLAFGRDTRVVVAERDARGISCETTFDTDLSDKAALEAELWPLAEKLARRLKKAESATATIVLKLTTAQFRRLSRRRTIGRPTQLADELFKAACALLAPELGKQRYRLIGIGAGELVPEAEAKPLPDLFDTGPRPNEQLERAVDAVREKFGDGAIVRGRGLVLKPRSR